MPHPKQRKKATDESVGIDRYEHQDQKRPNNPQVGMVTVDNDPVVGKKQYSYDPHLDPTLVWAGKKESQQIDVDTISIHVHERIDPKTIISSMHHQDAESYQASLFDQSFNKRPLREEVGFYQHKNAWTNRLIAGDSLLVMNSLLEKEGMAGSVQMAYIDPPYGIKYGSNFQPYTNQTQVKDGKDSDLNVEPEMIKAFRDTWELGIHSYLSYMRDRLLLTRELLSESGSCFVQISDENMHYIRNVMDDTFGAQNYVNTISVSKIAGGLESTKRISSKLDYLLWYSKNVKTLRYRPLYSPRDNDIEAGFNRVMLVDDTHRPLSKEEKTGAKLPAGSRLFRSHSLTKPGPGSKYTIEVDGKRYDSGGRWWGSPKESIEKLISLGRVRPFGNTLRYIKFLDDFPYKPLDNLWGGLTGARDPLYVVQTNDIIVRRCMLMTTDPGDLVLDPTCGSGTTAYVAEEWGRRWITVDTSRVAVQLARQRLLTSAFDWFKLAHTNEGVAGGFQYRKAPRITPSSVSNDESPQEEVLYDQPLLDQSITRVTGPFTVEAIPAPNTKPLQQALSSQPADSSIVRSGETDRQERWRGALLRGGVRAKAGDKIELARIEAFPGGRHIHAQAETADGKRVFVCFGPEHAPLEQTQVEAAIREAEHLKPSPNMVLFLAFQFDPEASKDIDEFNWPNVSLLKVQMNADLLTYDLKKNQSHSESFWLLGQPDVQVVKRDDGRFVVSIDGFDYYNPSNGEVKSGGKENIAAWMLDANYNQRSIFPTQIFLPMSGAKNGWQKLAKTLKAQLDEDLLESFKGTTSLPFLPGEHKCCAVKVIDDRGVEYFCIKSLS